MTVGVLVELSLDAEELDVPDDTEREEPTESRLEFSLEIEDAVLDRVEAPFPANELDDDDDTEVLEDDMLKDCSLPELLRGL
jgi:hypothetical protein